MRLLALLRVHEVHERLEGDQDVVSQVPAVEPGDHVLQHPHPGLHRQEDYDYTGCVYGSSSLGDLHAMYCHFWALTLSVL